MADNKYWISGAVRFPNRLQGAAGYLNRD
jgi:hypothetical protein